MAPTPALSWAPTPAVRSDRPAGAAAHSSAPTAPLVAGLNAEWTTLTRRPSSDEAARAWARREPALALAMGLVDVTVLAGGSGADAVLAALLRLAGAGDRLAARTVLQLQLGAAINLARRTSHYAAGDVEEAISRAVTFLWEAISCYPVDRRRGRHANGLALEVLNRLTAHTDNRPGRGARHAELVEVPQEDLLDALAGQASAPARPDPAVEVQQLLSWALSRGVLSADEGELLRRLHLAGEFDQAGVACELGVSHAALRQRSSRATRRLAEAVQRRTSAAAAGASHRRLVG